MKLALVVLILALPAYPQRLNSKLKKENRQIHSVLILPAEISLQLTGMKGNSGLPEESTKVGDSLYSAVAAELSIRGVTILPMPLPANPSDEERYALADLQQKYDTIAVQMNRKPAGVEKGRYTLGDQVSTYRPATKADALVFIRGGGRLLTPGRQVFGAVAWGGFTSTFRGRVVFVDARSGEVLALAGFNFIRNIANRSEDELRLSVRDGFHDLPLPIARVLK